ncbi:MAG: hypothetical protein ABJ004_01055 [Cyclobacteriaceae bacterium]
MNLETNNPEEQKGFKDLLRDIIIPKMEIISVAIIIIAFVLKYFEASGYASIFSIGLTTLAITSYLYAFLYKTEGFLENLVLKTGHIACSISIIGFLFTLLHLPGNQPMLNIGSAALAIATVAMIYLMTQSQSKKHRQITIRFVAILLLIAPTIFL